MPALGQESRTGRPKRLLGKHFLELRVKSDRIDLRRARGSLRILPSHASPIVHPLHFEDPSFPEPVPADASVRTIPLGQDGASVEVVVFAPPTDFLQMLDRRGSGGPDRSGGGYFFVDLLFDRPDPSFKAVLTLEADGRTLTAEFEHSAGRDAK